MIYDFHVLLFSYFLPALSILFRKIRSVLSARLSGKPIQAATHAWQPVASAFHPKARSFIFLPKPQLKRFRQKPHQSVFRRIYNRGLRIVVAIPRIRKISQRIPIQRK